LFTSCIYKLALDSETQQRVRVVITPAVTYWTSSQFAKWPPKYQLLDLRKNESKYQVSVSTSEKESKHQPLRNGSIEYQSLLWL